MNNLRWDRFAVVLLAISAWSLMTLILFANTHGGNPWPIRLLGSVFLAVFITLGGGCVVAVVLQIASEAFTALKRWLTEPPQEAAPTPAELERQRLLEEAMEEIEALETQLHDSRTLALEDRTDS